MGLVKKYSLTTDDIALMTKLFDDCLSKKNAYEAEIAEIHEGNGDPDILELRVPSYYESVGEKWQADYLRAMVERFGRRKAVDIQVDLGDLYDSMLGSFGRYDQYYSISQSPDSTGKTQYHIKRLSLTAGRGGANPYQILQTAPNWSGTQSLELLKGGLFGSISQKTVQYFGVGS